MLRAHLVDDGLNARVFVQDDSAYKVLVGQTLVTQVEMCNVPSLLKRRGDFGDVRWEDAAKNLVDGKVLVAQGHVVVREGGSIGRVKLSHGSGEEGGVGGW